jgi:hypothetical protein
MAVASRRCHDRRLATLSTEHRLAGSGGAHRTMAHRYHRPALLRRFRMITSLRCVRVVAIAIVASSIFGCAATLQHRPEVSALCNPAESNGWTGYETRWESRIITGNDYIFTLMDKGSRGGITGPVDHVYWVMFGAMTSGSAVGFPRLPMVYDPSSAVVEIDGRRVHALPRLWRAEQVRGDFVPTSEVAVPADLNVPDARFPNWYYMAFPMHTPRASDQWRLAGGTILLDGVQTPLPVAESCHTDADTRWVPIH